MPHTQPPYFDYLLSEMEKGNAILAKSFGTHMHWGYWDDPSQSLAGDENFRIAAGNLVKKFCRQADIADRQSVLDAGCGFGGTVEWINRHYEEMSIHGLSLDSRQLERAQCIVQPRAANHISFVNGDAIALPFADNSFDRILALGCIFHLPSRKSFLAEAQRVLKPGGLLCITDYVASPLINLQCNLLRLPLVERYNFFGRFNFITRRRYRAYARQLGFRMQEEDISRHTLPTYIYLKSVVKRYPLPTRYQRYAKPGILLLQWATITRLLSYRLLTFKKEL